MNKFDWDAFFRSDSNIAVSCRTEEEAADFIRKACRNKEFKKKWCSCGKTEYDTDWHCLKETTCYFNNGFGQINDELSNSYKIIRWSSYMPKDRNLYDLKEKYLQTGYVVKAYNGFTYLVLIYDNNIHFLDLNNNNYVEYHLSDYDNHLTNRINSDHTIISIYDRIKTLDDLKSLPRLIWTENSDK